MVRQLSDEKRERYLQAALKLFAKNGVQNTSTAAIAREAGTAAGTLFLYFPTKQDLINALIWDIGKDHSAYIHSLLQTEIDAKTTFEVIFMGSVRWFLDHLDAYLYDQEVRHARLVDENVVRESEQFLGYYFTAIQRGLSEGSIKSYPMDVIGNMLYHGMAAVIEMTRDLKDKELVESYLNMGFEIFWNGIKA